MAVVARPSGGGASLCDWRAEAGDGSSDSGATIWDLRRKRVPEEAIEASVRKCGGGHHLDGGQTRTLQGNG